MSATSDAMSDVRLWQFERRRDENVTLRKTQVMIALSGLSTGLKHIECGRVEPGVRLVQHGIDYLRSLLGETS